MAKKERPRHEPNKAIIAVCAVVGVALGLVYLGNALFGLGVGTLVGIVLGSIYENHIK